MATSVKVSDSLYLVQQPISKTVKTVEPATVPVDHILVYDCSGSMTYDLPKIRDQVKRKLPKMLGEKDTLSVVWFSGRGQFGVLFEAEPVATLADLQQMNKAVDRWLVPVGMTGFKEPMLEVSSLAKRLAKKNPKSVRSLLFFTDGCDNQWAIPDVLKAVKRAGGAVQSATFIEYGYYANRPLLAQMAEKSGGSLIFAESFDRYEPQFETSVKRKPTGAKRIEVEIEGDIIGGFCFAMGDGSLTTFSVAEGKATVPEDLDQLHYLSTRNIGRLSGDLTLIANGVRVGDALAAAHGTQTGCVNAAYAAVSLFAVRMKPDVVLPLLKALGDVTFIQEFANCFGKQKYSAFMDGAKGAAFDRSVRWTKGYNPDLVPRDDAFTVPDVLNLLQEDERARVLLGHAAFKYTRIGRGRVDATDQLSRDEQAQVAELTAEMSRTKDAKKLNDLAEQIALVTDKPGALKFTRNLPAAGLPIQSLTFNEDRPNISFLVKIPGSIDLSARLAGSPLASVLPASLPCFQYRNYTVIKDGLVNIAELPVVVSAETFRKLVAEGVVDVAGGSPRMEGHAMETVIDLAKLAIINRKMVQSLSAQSFFETNYDLAKARAAQKVYKDYAKGLLPEKKSQGYADKFGDDAAQWLKEQGITDYNGYQPPHTTQAASTDVYVGKELKVSLKGLSSLPKVAEVKGKLMKTGSDGRVEWVASPKLTASSALMATAVMEVEGFLASDIYANAADKPGVLQAWLEGQTRASIRRTRALLFDLARTTFCTVVGQVWFKEFASLDENELTLSVDGQQVPCKVEMMDIQIAV